MLSILVAMGSLLSMLAAMVLSLAPDTPRSLSPSESYAAAYEHWRNLPVESRLYTRYLSLRNYGRLKKPDVLDAVAFAANSLSWSQELSYPPLAEGSEDLIRIDLRWYEWDYWTRKARLARLESAGIDFGLKPGKDRETFINIWERLADQDVVYRATKVDTRTGYVFRGWIDPVMEADVRSRAYTVRLVMDADYFLAFTGIDRADGVNQGFFNGYYSDFLMLPRKEADLFKLLGSDETFIDREQLKRGGAVLQSIVALNNRELVLFPTLVGQSQKFLWFSRDTISNADSGDSRRSVTENFLDTLVPDGGEAIFTIPNGLHGYWLENANKVQVREVPSNNVARDLSQPLKVPGRRVDVVVRNWFSCVGCHDTGINPFDDVVRRMLSFRQEAGQLNIVAKSYDRAAELQRELRNYYTSQLGRTIAAQSKDYIDTVMAVNRMDSKHSAFNYTELVRDYFFRDVTPEQAAREWGIDPSSIKAFVRDARKQVNGVEQGQALVPLLFGQSISREAFRNSFDDAMQGQNFSWEAVPVGVQKGAKRP